MTLLAGVSSPADVKALPPGQLSQLAMEIREHLVASVCRTGGHLGPNLGVVELTIALHRVFDSPRDVLLWDTGHQAYVHKMLTGRVAEFDTLRQPGGLSGYPSRAESEHDVIENSHASTALSYADGMAKAFALTGQRDRAVVAVVGDGALTGGMCWEALNNIAAADRPVVVVVNDNGRSYAPTIGGLAQHLAALRLRPAWDATLSRLKQVVPRTPVVGRPVYAAMHGVKEGLKDLLAPQAMFEDLGLKYVGPVDGHDVAAVEAALQGARSHRGPVVVHCMTVKGRGYEPAENDVADCFHGVGALDPVTGRPLATGAALPWTQVLGTALHELARERVDLVAVTAAMMRPVGLQDMAAEFPDRVFDVGIAEQHALTSAAGLATAGLHPVVCLYATFLNRAFDQVLMDVALHRQPVTVVLDRAGITGDDGASHHGIWDLALMRIVPGLRVAAPRDAASLRELLREAVDVEGPTVVRFPKAQTGADIPSIGRVGVADVLRAHLDARMLVIPVGPLAEEACAAADMLHDEGLGVTVVDPRWVLPVDDALVHMAAAYDVVVTVEDGIVDGGVGEAVAARLRALGSDARVVTLGLAKRFVEQGRRGDLLAAAGLDRLGIVDVLRAEAATVGLASAQPILRATAR